MAWHTSDRRERLPKDWAARRLAVMERDQWKCQWLYPNGGRCSAPANQCDHIDRKGSDSIDNLRALCEKHHYRKSAQEGAEAKKQNIARAKAIVKRIEEDPSKRVTTVAPSRRRGY